MVPERRKGNVNIIYLNWLRERIVAIRKVGKRRIWLRTGKK
jgi:hypothetical protein